jgi:hypothetical protein
MGIKFSRPCAPLQGGLARQEAHEINQRRRGRLDRFPGIWAMRNHVRSDMGIGARSQKKGQSNLFSAAPTRLQDVANSVSQRII